MNSIVLTVAAFLVAPPADSTSVDRLFVRVEDEIGRPIPNSWIKVVDENKRLLTDPNGKGWIQLNGKGEFVMNQLSEPAHGKLTLWAWAYDRASDGYELEWERRLPTVVLTLAKKRQAAPQMAVPQFSYRVERVPTYSSPNLGTTVSPTVQYYSPAIVCSPNVASGTFLSNQHTVQYPPSFVVQQPTPIVTWYSPPATPCAPCQSQYIPPAIFYGPAVTTSYYPTVVYPCPLSTGNPVSSFMYPY